MPIALTHNPLGWVLTWKYPANPNVGSWNIMRSESGSPFALLAVLTAAARGYTDLTIVQGHTYTYRADVVIMSNPVTVTTPADVISLVAPLPPTNPTILP